MTPCGLRGPINSKLVPNGHYMGFYKNDDSRLSFIFQNSYFELTLFTPYSIPASPIGGAELEHSHETGLQFCYECILLFSSIAPISLKCLNAFFKKYFEGISLHTILDALKSCE